MTMIEVIAAIALTALAGEVEQTKSQVLYADGVKINVAAEARIRVMLAYPKETKANEGRPNVPSRVLILVGGDGANPISIEADRVLVSGSVIAIENGQLKVVSRDVPAKP